MNERKYDIFVSYQGEDQTWVSKLAERIQQEDTPNGKLKVFFDKWEIKPGENLVAKINRALEESKFFVLVMTPEYLRAEWPNAEMSAAICSDVSGRIGRLVPLILRKCKLPPLLRFRNYIDFTDETEFEQNFGRLMRQIVGEPSLSSPPLLLDHAAETGYASNYYSPDSVTEDIYSNLFPIKNLPDVIWSAPTKFASHLAIFDYFAGKRVPPFILKEGRLFTFLNLGEQGTFTGVIEDYDLSGEKTVNLLKDKNKRNWVLELLNVALNRHLKWEKRLTFNKEEKMNYYSVSTLKQNTAPWKPHLKEGPKKLYIQRTNRFDHRAVGARFILIGSQLFLRIEAGWVFTYDGEDPISGQRSVRLATKKLVRQKNLQAFSEMRFWAWLLSEGDEIQIWLGDKHLKMDVMPLKIRSSFGINGDTKPVPRPKDAPPDLFLEDNLAGDGDG